MVSVDSRKIPVEGDVSVSSEWVIPDSYDRRTAVVIAHGAGNDMNNPLLTYIHRSLGGRGNLCVKFNFLYKEQGRRAPDHPKRLMATWRAVIDRVLADTDLAPENLVLSGKSLGGRMASMVQAEDASAQGLVFFGYPLHPPGQPEKIRTKHLPGIRCPMLFIQGTRDPLCDLALLDSEVVRPHDKVTLHVIQGGDHSFKVPKKMQREEQSVWREIVDITAQWINANMGDGP